jgi:Skp family chaperone for outer membrane proteins
MTLTAPQLIRRRMRRALFTALATTVALGGTAPAHAQSSRDVPTARIGLIDSRRLLHEMPGRSQAESQFALEMTEARLQVRVASDSMKQAIDALSRVESELRPQQRESAMMVVRARELALEDMVSQLNLRADKRLQELQAPLLVLLGEAVKTVRARERLSLVLDLAAGAMIVDADGTLDIHALVLEELRRRAARPAGR